MNQYSDRFNVGTGGLHTSRLSTSVLAFVGLVAGGLSSSACVRAENPYDTDTPRTLQARATLRGTAQAVFSLQAGEVLVGPAGDDETLVEPIFCDIRAGERFCECGGPLG